MLIHFTRILPFLSIISVNGNVRVDIFIKEFVIKILTPKGYNIRHFRRDDSLSSTVAAAR